MSKSEPIYGEPGNERANPVELKPARKEKKTRRNQSALNIREEAFRIRGADLTQIDVISESAALGLIAEIGVDMSPWKTEKQFASWLALSPNHKISGGKILKRPRARQPTVPATCCVCAHKV